ncbi:MAG: hypothetical protein QF536_10120 [Arenicellales bacterium]|jgi:hypothetical protein|nr:hypothetical protein [Arenicellales bacterium]MDP6725532.1 hypothetical protein [Arenicellales bacterium]
MKTSIFDMNFTLPPLIEMHEVTKDMDSGPSDMTTWCPPCRQI